MQENSTLTREHFAQTCVTATLSTPTLDNMTSIFISSSYLASSIAYLYFGLRLFAVISRLQERQPLVVKNRGAALKVLFFGLGCFCAFAMRSTLQLLKTAGVAKMMPPTMRDIFYPYMEWYIPDLVTGIWLTIIWCPTLNSEDGVRKKGRRRAPIALHRSASSSSGISGTDGEGNVDNDRISSSLSSSSSSPDPTHQLQHALQPAPSPQTPWQESLPLVALSSQALCSGQRGQQQQQQQQQQQFLQRQRYLRKQRPKLYGRRRSFGPGTAASDAFVREQVERERRWEKMWRQISL